MKEYSLFLDESGNFDSDIDNKGKNECLVAGFYIEGNPDSRSFNDLFVRKEILKSWYRAVDTLTRKENDAFNSINHATSIKRGKLADRLAPVALDIFYGMKKNGASFTIFENNRRAHLVDSNTLYLNILAEGVIDTMIKLWKTDEAPIKLYVCIGKRRDTEKSEVGTMQVIGPEEYSSRLKEKLTLQKIVNQNLDFRKCEFDIKFLDDKKDSRMVVCDYLCNLYFTRDSDFLSAYREKYDEFFANISKYRMGENQERDRINHYLERKMYGALLLEICYGNIQETQLQKNARRDFCSLGSTDIKNAYDEFGKHIDDVVTRQRNFELAKKLLKNALDVLSDVKDTYRNAKQTEYDLWLYQETVYSHMGDIKLQGEALKRSQECFLSVANDLSNFDRYFILANRHALYEHYVYNSEEADKICTKSEKLLFDLATLIFSELGTENQNQGEQKIVQLAKMYGTHAQIALCLYNEGKHDYEYVKKLIDNAISYFSEESDMSRQYQVRADLEADCGNINEALDFIAKSNGVPLWTSIAPVMKNDFIAYHISRIALSAQKNGNEEISRRILKKYETSLEKFANDIGNMSFDHVSVMPDCISAFNFALVHTYLGGSKYIQLIEKIVGILEENRITFYPQLAAEAVLCSGENNAKRWERAKNSTYIIEMIDSVICGAYPEVTKSFFNEWRERLTTGSHTDIVAFSKTRLY